MKSYENYRRDKILRYMDSIKNGWRKFPPSLQVATTDYCFNKCITCGHWQREDKKMINLGQYLAFLKGAAFRGLESVCYSGGDPFCYPYIAEIMDWHIANGVKYGFICSGYFDKSKISAQALQQASWLRVSLDSLDNYKECRGGITIEKVKQSIEWAVENEIDIRFGITVHRYNCNEMIKLFDYALRLEIKEVRVWVVRNREELKLSAEQTERLKKALTEYAGVFDGFSVSNNLALTKKILIGEKESFPFTKCFAVLLQLFIAADGKVYPCCITAGDTESKVQSAPLGRLGEGFVTLERAAEKHLNKSLSELPPICSTNCIARLSSINYFTEQFLSRGEFI